MRTETKAVKTGHAKCAKGKDCVAAGTMIPRVEYNRFKRAAETDKRSLARALLVGAGLYSDKILGGEAAV